VQGCLEWQQKSLTDIPACVKNATASYQEEQDLLGRWLEEACELKPNYETLSSSLYSNYREWAIDNGQRPLSNIALGRKLSERGFICRASNGKRYWCGIAFNQKPQRWY
jgi:putative DNA primase/helicase